MSPCDQTIPGGFTKKACLLWLSYITSHTRYFEWGSGFTTRTADPLAYRVTSIEGSKQWYETMKRQHTFRASTRLVHVDIGETGKFSWPLHTNISQHYVHAIRETQDVVLVDGRWRVACALVAFQYLEPTGTLLVHDFQRPAYHFLLNVYEKEHEVDGLAVLRKKQDVSNEFLQKHLRRFMVTPNR